VTKIEAALSGAYHWLVSRLSEPSTKIGIVTVALICLGWDNDRINALVAALGLVLGGGLIAHKPE
jgi:hypothetical protein